MLTAMTGGVTLFPVHPGGTSSRRQSQNLLFGTRLRGVLRPCASHLPAPRSVPRAGQCSCSELGPQSWSWDPDLSQATSERWGPDQ